MNALDLFAGPGGWDEGVAELGIFPLGIEWDDAACETRRAAGHKTLQADVSQLDPHDFGPCELLIASPPCQSFSAAGKGDGRKDMTAIMRVARELGYGRDVRDEVAVTDPRSLLIVEPLRWALALRPRFLAFEQVPPVLSLWRDFAETLRIVGYSVWAGVLSAEQYGVPQTRKRAILVASLAGPVSPPQATHQAYEPGVPAREVHTLEGSLLPWVSMAEALGCGGHAPTHYDRRQGNTQGDGSRKMVRLIPITDPAPTLGSAGLSTGRDVWVGDGCGDPLELKGGNWPERRPATTIAGDSRVFQPGGHHGQGEQSQNSIRVTQREAAILQGFRPDYPFRGSRTKRFEQVGNAVPPPFARAVVGGFLDVAMGAAA